MAVIYSIFCLRFNGKFDIFRLCDIRILFFMDSIFLQVVRNANFERREIRDANSEMRNSIYEI